MNFNSDNVLLEVSASTQKDVLEEIAERAADLGVTSDKEKLAEDFEKREKEFSTGFGNGVAIPHAKSDIVVQPAVFFLRLNNGVDWNSMDGSLVNLVIAIIVPTQASKEHLDTLAKLSRKIIHPDFIDSLNKGDKEEITQLIKETIS